MEPNDQEKRQGAAKEFQESLEHLQHLLEENQTEELVTESQFDPIPQEPTVEDSPIFNLDEWEDAVADIEEYFKNKDKDK